jgi:hypothetical protein
MVITLTIQNGFTYVLATLPPHTKELFEKWVDESRFKMNRLPIKDSEKRQDGLNEELLKWGEIFLRSSGLADIFLDYYGRILLESQKQITLNIGDRDTDNKITSPELTVSFGRIVDSSGELKKDADSKNIKVEINVIGKTTITVNEDGGVKINSDDVNIAEGTKGCAREDDPVEVTVTAAQIASLGLTAGGAAVIAPFPTNNTKPTGTITDSSEKVKVG